MAMRWIWRPRPIMLVLFLLAICAGSARRPAHPVSGFAASPAMANPVAGGADRRTAPGDTAGKDVPILMYHYLTTGTPPTIYYLTAHLFERQMAALAAYGYQTVSLEEFLDYRSGRATPPEHPVILTIDDGERSGYDIARPVWIALGMRATYCVTTGWIGATPAERQGNVMVWNPEIQQLYAEGFAIEAHSITHPNLTQIPLIQAAEEISGSRISIQQHLGSTVHFFCYPGGHGAYTESVRELVRQAGYEAALAAWFDGIANTATSDIWALPRLLISETNSVDLDPAHPDNFFMRKLDPAFPLPAIDVPMLESFDAAGRRRTCFAPGEPITVRVTVRNQGSPADVWVSLALDDGADFAHPYYQGSRQIALLTSASPAFAYVPDTPDGRTLGVQYAMLDFADKAQVLGFGHTGPLPAFLLSDHCRPSSFLPIIKQVR
jgi:peptidoglycan/xylan/chitin deacetylase (PgdA/CDA1 family)